MKLTLIDGVYAVDHIDTTDSATMILAELGTIMEAQFTTSKENFQLLLKGGTGTPPNFSKAFHYVQTGNLLLRSQLDCHHQSLPRKIFDLKTRATIPIRLDVENYRNYISYQLKKPVGLIESFEREYFDMVRSSFLKFSFQVRIGKMDGILVGFHNTEEIFGFQYIPLSGMDSCVFGNSQFAEASFSLSVKLFDHLLHYITSRFPGRVRSAVCLFSLLSTPKPPPLSPVADFDTRTSK